MRGRGPGLALVVCLVLAAVGGVLVRERWPDAAGGVPNAVGAPVDAAPGESATVFTAVDVPGRITNFAVYGAVQRSDGSILVSYDRSAEQAGDDRGGPSPDPQLVLGDAAGRWLVVDPPDVDGSPVPASALPLAAADDGSVFLWDRARTRVVAWGPDGTWRGVADLPPSAQAYETLPSGAIGPEGELYVAAAASVFRIDIDGTVTRIAGSDQVNPSGWPAPEPGERRAPTGSMPLLSGVIVDGAGIVYVTTVEDYVLAISPDGGLFSFGHPTALTATAPPTPGDTGRGRMRLTRLALDVDGGILALDIVHRRVLRIGADRTTVAAEGIAQMQNGARLATSPTGDLLVTLPDEDSLAVHELTRGG